MNTGIPSTSNQVWQIWGPDQNWEPVPRGPIIELPWATLTDWPQMWSCRLMFLAVIFLRVFKSTVTLHASGSCSDDTKLGSSSRVATSIISDSTDVDMTSDILTRQNSQLPVFKSHHDVTRFRYHEGSRWQTTECVLNFHLICTKFGKRIRQLFHLTATQYIGQQLTSGFHVFSVLSTLVCKRKQKSPLRKRNNRVFVFCAVADVCKRQFSFDLCRIWYADSLVNNSVTSGMQVLLCNLDVGPIFLTRLNPIHKWSDPTQK